ncbi:MAG TPA: hypothetical protein VH877_12170 [Polyangia bacterium]|nr:hypothetical protein [Polyangia bacterium]
MTRRPPPGYVLGVRLGYRIRVLRRRHPRLATVAPPLLLIGLVALLFQIC